MSETFSVVAPITEEVGTGMSGARVSIAPRLGDLNGKTVCEVWNGVFRGDALFPIIRKQLKKRYQGVNVIPYTETPLFTMGEDTNKICEDLKVFLSQKRCDALIAGVGG